MMHHMHGDSFGREDERSEEMDDTGRVLTLDLESLESNAYSEDEFWEGDFDEYLKITSEHPEVAYSAYQRLYKALGTHGSHSYRFARRDTTHWNFLDDPMENGRDAIYGLDSEMDRFMQVVEAAASRYGQERRLILLHGPVGSSKSTVARLLRKALETYTKTEEGQVYTHSWVINEDELARMAEENSDSSLTAETVRDLLGLRERQNELRCPLHEDPLRLLPHDTRAKLADDLNKIQVFDGGESRDRRPEEFIAFEGEPCPLCRFVMNGFLRRYNGDWQAVLRNHIRVQRLIFSEVDRIGLGSFRPKDEKNQDSTELSGDVNFRALAELGVESDPRAFNFDGEFQVSNRGMFYVEEIFKLDKAFLYDFLGATQEHMIKPKRFAEMHIDTVLIGGTNGPEYDALVGDATMEAFRDRTTRIDIPYVLDLRQEEKIYEKVYQFVSGSKHIAPHTIGMGALWAILTRLDEPKGSLDILQKLKLYAGQSVAGYTEEHLRELWEEAENEGMHGISPRYIQDKVAAAIVADDALECVTPFALFRQLEDGLKYHSLIKESEQEGYKKFLATMKEEFDNIIKREIQIAVAADESDVQKLFDNYIENVVAYVQKEKIKDEITGEDKEPNERLMREIEEKIKVADSAKDEFRSKIVQSMGVRLQRGQTFDYKSDEQLADAITLKLFDDRRDSIRLESLHTRAPDAEDQEKIDVIKKRLVDQFGYCTFCATMVLNRVASIWSRGDAKSEEKSS